MKKLQDIKNNLVKEYIPVKQGLKPLQEVLKGFGYLM